MKVANGVHDKTPTCSGARQSCSTFREKPKPRSASFRFWNSLQSANPEPASKTIKGRRRTRSTRTYGLPQHARVRGRSMGEIAPTLWKPAVSFRNRGRYRAPVRTSSRRSDAPERSHRRALAVPDPAWRMGRRMRWRLGKAIDVLAAHPVGYEERLLGDRLTVGLLRFNVPYGKAAAARTAWPWGGCSAMQCSRSSRTCPIPAGRGSRHDGLEQVWIAAHVAPTDPVLAWLHTKHAQMGATAAGQRPHVAPAHHPRKDLPRGHLQRGRRGGVPLPRRPLEVVEQTGRNSVIAGDRAWSPPSPTALGSSGWPPCRTSTAPDESAKPPASSLVPAPAMVGVSPRSGRPPRR